MSVSCLLQVPNMVLKMDRAEKRSILIVWQTTEVVIEKLSKDFVQRFSHLKTQGVLQLIVGGREIDFSYQRTPQIYRIEVSLAVSHIIVTCKMKCHICKYC